MMILEEVHLEEWEKISEENIKTGVVALYFFMNNNKRIKFKFKFLIFKTLSFCMSLYIFIQHASAYISITRCTEIVALYTLS
jgi:hypothetical protein